jgi:hypothetical protein
MGKLTGLGSQMAQWWPPKATKMANLGYKPAPAAASWTMCETRVYWLSIDVLVASGESLLVMIWVLLYLPAMVECVCFCCFS